MSDSTKPIHQDSSPYELPFPGAESAFSVGDFHLSIHLIIYDMTTLYLVRHGETVANASQILQGQTPGALNKTGIQQAEAVHERLKNEPIDAFVASDLQRASDTCLIIAHGHGREVRTTPLLRERDWGDFTGAFIPDLKGKPFPANVETIDELMARARRFLHFLQAQYPEKTVLAVGHGIINKAIQSVFYGIPMSEVPKMGNAEVRKLELDDH